MMETNVLYLKIDEVLPHTGFVIVSEIPQRKFIRTTVPVSDNMFQTLEPHVGKTVICNCEYSVFPGDEWKYANLRINNFIAVFRGDVEKGLELLKKIAGPAWSKIDDPDEYIRQLRCDC